VSLEIRLLLSVFLPDGEVDNTDECIKAVRLNAQTTRVFTFGIGAEASIKLVKGMAEAGEGKHEIVLSGQNMDEKGRIWSVFPPLELLFIFISTSSSAINPCFETGFD